MSETKVRPIGDRGREGVHKGHRTKTKGEQGMKIREEVLITNRTPKGGPWKRLGVRNPSEGAR